MESRRTRNGLTGIMWRNNSFNASFSAQPHHSLKLNACRLNAKRHLSSNSKTRCKCFTKMDSLTKRLSTCSSTKFPWSEICPSLPQRKMSQTHGLKLPNSSKFISEPWNLLNKSTIQSHSFTTFTLPQRVQFIRSTDPSSSHLKIYFRSARSAATMAIPPTIDIATALIVQHKWPLYATNATVPALVLCIVLRIATVLHHRRPTRLTTRLAISLRHRSNIRIETVSVKSRSWPLCRSNFTRSGHQGNRIRPPMVEISSHQYYTV